MLRQRVHIKAIKPISHRNDILITKRGYSDRSVQVKAVY